MASDFGVARLEAAAKRGSQKRELLRRRVRRQPVEQSTGVGVDPHSHALFGDRRQHIALDVGNGRTGIVGQGPFGQPLETEFTIEAVEIGDAGEQAVGMFPHIKTVRSPAKLDHGGRERGVSGGVDAFAGELAKRTVDHGDGLKRGVQRVEQKREHAGGDSATTNPDFLWLVRAPIIFLV